MKFSRLDVLDHGRASSSGVTKPEPETPTIDSETSSCKFEAALSQPQVYGPNICLHNDSTN